MTALPSVGVTAPISGSWFPCKAEAPDGTKYDTCRVVAEAGRTVVWAWDRSLRTALPVIESVGPPLELPPNETTETYRGRPLRSFVIEMADDDVAAFSEQAGCGCSHPMKSWRPPKPNRAGT